MQRALKAAKHKYQNNANVASNAFTGTVMQHTVVGQMAQNGASRPP